jgi:hypothetical protein
MGCGFGVQRWHTPLHIGGCRVDHAAVDLSGGK